MKTTYTKDEFIKKFDEVQDPKLKNFFDHIDRYTSDLERIGSRPDFYKFFGISKATITEKKGEGTFYAIPFEVAPLLAGMIRAFSFAYGNDRRGRSKNKVVPLDYERYHKYIAEMQKQIGQIEPYQRALIKNYKAFNHAFVIDAFLPLLIERIAIFMVMLLCYGGEQTGDTLIGAIHGFDWLIKDLTKCHLQQQYPELSSKSSYTFENAIARVFSILTRQKVEQANPNEVISVEMENNMIDAINDSVDCSASESGEVWSVENMRDLITNSLNLQYRMYILDHPDYNSACSSQILHKEHEQREWWTVSGQLNKDESSLVSNINLLIVRLVRMRNGLGEFLWLKDKFIDTEPEPLTIEDREKLNDEETELYEKYKFFTSKGIEFVTDAMENLMTFWDFVAQRTMECVSICWDRETAQSELEDNPILKSIIDTTQNEQNNERLKMVKAALYQAVTPLLTSQITK